MIERERIYKKSNGRCWYCGTKLKERWHVDHFKPVKRWNGKMENPELDTFENKVPSCPSCNILKSSMSIDSFRWLIQNFIKSLNRDVNIYKHAKRYGLIEETDKKVKFYFEKKGLRP